MAASEARPNHAVAVVGPGWVQIGRERRQVDVRSAWQALRITEAVPLHHPNSSVQVWILAEQVQALQLEVYAENPDASPKTQRTSVERQLAKAAEPFLAEALANGWTLDERGFSARTTLTRTDPHTHARRWVQFVLEPYQWIHDTRGDAVAGDDDPAISLDEDPVVRAGQIIARVETVDRLLGVLPMSTPALTGQKILDVQARRKATAQRRGKRAVNAAGSNTQRIVTEPGTLPDFDGRAGLKGEVVPATTWWRQPSAEEVDRATFAVQLDQRWSYVAQCSSLILGYGTPTHIDADTATALADRARRGDTEANKTFAVWRLQPTVPRVWGDPRMPPPHQDLGNLDSPTWAPPPTMRTLLSENDEHGCGATLEEIGITGAYLWPEAGRMLEPLYRKVKAAWDHTVAIQGDPDHDPELLAWLTRFGKSVGRATIGRLASEYGRNDALGDPENGRQARPHRFQPIWWETAKAACSAKLWWQAHQLATRHHIWPIHAATDALTYLVDYDTLVALEDALTQRLGVLKIDKVVLLGYGAAADTLRQLRNLGGRNPAKLINWDPVQLSEGNAHDPDGDESAGLDDADAEIYDIDEVQ